MLDRRLDDGALPVRQDGAALGGSVAGLGIGVRPVDEDLCLGQAVRAQRRVGGGERHGSRTAQVEQRAVEGREVLVDGRDGIAARRKALGEA